MTPAARWAAAAEIMDEITAGSPAEKALTNWARRSRFAGSKDRAAVRDHVFDILRSWRSVAAQGGGSDGRRLVLGRLRQIGLDPDTVFSGDRHALAELTQAEKVSGSEPEGAVKADLQDWIFDIFVRDFQDKSDLYSEVLKSRAPVFLRVNLAKTNVAEAQANLAEDGVETKPHPLSPTALEVTHGMRRVNQSSAYLNGLVELQDVASQAVVDALPLERGLRVLDYCAGGGGKTLAMAAKTGGLVFAHDANPARMKDLPDRAVRAGAKVQLVSDPTETYELVLCDVPCSGSGSWRRSPEGKWRLTPEALERTQKVQSQILNKAAQLVAPGGYLAYATCSVFNSENEDQIEGFLERHGTWYCKSKHRFDLDMGGDGFFLAILTRNSA